MLAVYRILEQGIDQLTHKDIKINNGSKLYKKSFSSQIMSNPISSQ